MLKVTTLREREIFGPNTPEYVYNFYEWSKKNDGTLSRDFFNHSKYLSLTNLKMNYDQPPGIFLVGREAEGRKVFGDEWADSFTKNNKISPISELDTVTAPGYINAAANGFNLDMVEYKDNRSQGVYCRMIVPLRPSYGFKYNYTAMLAFSLEHQFLQ